VSTKYLARAATSWAVYASTSNARTPSSPFASDGSTYMNTPKPASRSESESEY
jgi:hypothetical protein